jgi:NADH/NAD ratio-sensing transcriptional regulator Rex
MSGAWEEITGANRHETYAEAIARWNATRTESTMSEQAMAEKLVADRERVRRHDAYFADAFLSAGEQRMVSVELARKLGHMPSQERRDDYAVGDD